MGVDVAQFGQAVRIARESRDMTVTKLASLVGFKQPYLSKLEAGTLGHDPNPQLVRDLIRELKLDVDFIIPEEGPRHRKVDNADDAVVDFVERLAERLPPSILKRFGDECRAAADQLRTRFYSSETAMTMYQVAKTFYRKRADSSDEASMLYGIGRCEYELGRGRGSGKPGQDLPPRQQLDHFKRAMHSFDAAFEAMRQRYELGKIAIAETNVAHRESSSNQESVPDYEEARIGARNTHEFIALVAYTARAIRRVGLHVRDGILDLAEGLNIEPDYVQEILNREDLRWREKAAATLTNNLTSESIFEFNNELAKRLLSWCMTEHNNLAHELDPLGSQLGRWATAVRSEAIKEERDREWYGNERQYDTKSIADKFEELAEAHRQSIQELRKQHKKAGWQSVDNQSRWLLMATYIHREVGFTYCSGNNRNYAAAFWHYNLAQMLVPDEDEAERDVIAETFMVQVLPEVEGDSDLMAQVALLRKRQINKSGDYSVKPPVAFQSSELTAGKKKRDRALEL